MNCKLCGKNLRADNTIGFCREHRSHSIVIKTRVKKFAHENKDRVKMYKTKYRKENNERLNKDMILRRLDPTFKLATILRTRLNGQFKRKGMSCNSSIATKYLGCSLEELKRHIESKFKEDMCWSNHGVTGWHIDHIKPFSQIDLTSDSDLKEVCHYTNLQPLWYFENMAKRSEDRIPTSGRRPNGVKIYADLHGDM